MPVYQDRKVGTYRAVYQGSTTKLMGDPEEPRYIWRFQEKSDPTTAGELSKITSTNLKNSQSNAYKMMFGLFGRKPQDGDDDATCIGKEYDVQWGPNQAGNLTIVGVTPAYPGEDAALAPKPTDQHIAEERDTAELPF